MPSGMLKYLWVTFVVIFIDQITKWMAEANLELGGESYKVFPHLNFSLAYNEGAAFGFLDGARWFFVILAVVVTIAILIWLARLSKSEKWTARTCTSVRRCSRQWHRPFTTRKSYRFY